MDAAFLSPSTVNLVRVPAMLKALRARAGVSQRELARRLGVAQPVVARWESGGDVPRWETVGRFASACGFEIDLSFRAVDDVDRGQLREHLAMSPGDRLRSLANVARFRAAAVRVG